MERWGKESEAQGEDSIDASRSSTELRKHCLISRQSLATAPGCSEAPAGLPKPPNSQESHLLKSRLLTWRSEPDCQDQNGWLWIVYICVGLSVCQENY